MSAERDERTERLLRFFENEPETIAQLQAMVSTWQPMSEQAQGLWRAARRHYLATGPSKWADRIAATRQSSAIDTAQAQT